MSDLSKTKLLSALKECSTHLQRLNYAYGNISQFLPASHSKLANLSDEQIEALDQYIYRFTKWQDTMGQRLFKNLLAYLVESVRSMAFIDQLNRLEQLGVLASSQEWLELRQLRNHLAHEYEENEKERAKVINMLFDKHQRIITIFEQVKQYVEKV